MIEEHHFTVTKTSESYSNEFPHNSKNKESMQMLEPCFLRHHQMPFLYHVVC